MGVQSAGAHGTPPPCDGVPGSLHVCYLADRGASLAGLWLVEGLGLRYYSVLTLCVRACHHLCCPADTCTDVCPGALLHWSLYLRRLLASMCCCCFRLWLVPSLIGLGGRLLANMQLSGPAARLEPGLGVHCKRVSAQLADSSSMWCTWPTCAAVCCCIVYL
jgi:hypothetical protein